MGNIQFEYNNTKYLLKKLVAEKHSIMDKQYYIYSKTAGLLLIDSIKELRYLPTLNSSVYAVALINPKNLTRPQVELTEEQLCQGLIKTKKEWMTSHPNLFI